MKSVLITGVSSGIGKACALYFIEKGYQVFGSVRRPEDAQSILKGADDQFIPLIFDVTDDSSIAQAVTRVESLLKGPGLDVLINNAGMSVNGPLAYISLEEFATQLDVNVLGVMRVTQAFLPLLGFNNDRPKGHIINISSGSGRVTRPFMGPYSASKYALESISDGFRRELLDFGIKVTIIEPGPIKSEIWNKAKGNGKGHKYEHTPYKAIYDKLDVMVGKMEAMALDTNEVAALIYEVAEGRKNRTRYLIAPKKWLFWLAIHVFPDRVLDNMFSKQFAKLTEGSK